MKVLMITGSRGWTNVPEIARRLREYDPKSWIVMHGNARGADKLTGEVAKELGFEVQVVPAMWDAYGKRAGFKRNEEMAAVADECIAFWDGDSRGTRHAINACRDRGVPTRVFHLPPTCPQEAVGPVSPGPDSN